MRVLRHFSANYLHLLPFPFKRELSMESYLIENPDVLSLDDGSFCDVEIVEGELTLRQGRASKGTDGRIDILLTYSGESIGIVELKLGELGESHLTQLEDYLEERTRITQDYPELVSKDAGEPRWIGVLVGESISHDLAKKLGDGYLSSSGIQVAALTIKRFICPKGQDVYVITDSFFKSGVKDTTKYSFDGKTWGKGRLVLAVVKKHVENNPNILYSELERQFPAKCQGSLGVIKTVSDANEIYGNSNRKRHFLKPEEVVELEDARVAVCNQWGIENISAFISCAKEHGYKIEEAQG